MSGKSDHKVLYGTAGKNIPLPDIDKISLVIDEFLDAVHHSREEDSYFPCVASYDHLKEEIHNC